MSNAPDRLNNFQIAIGLLVAAMIGWTAVVVRDVWWPVIVGVFATTPVADNDRAMEFTRLWIATKVYAVFGLPLAALLCLAVGFPTWRFMEMKGFRRARHAALAGATAGFAIGFLLIAASIIFAGNYSSWDNQGQLVDNGWPTTRGWLRSLNLVFGMMVVGILSGLGAWLAVARYKS